MKTIANIIIINSQNVKLEHLHVSSHHNISFQRIKLCLHLDDREFHRSRQHWTAKAATRYPKIPQTPASWPAYKSYCMHGI